MDRGGAERQMSLLRCGRVAIEEATVSAGGLRFRTLVSGPERGPLVLLLHGFPQSSSCWTNALATLGDAGYRAVAPDQRGYTPDARPDGVDSYRVSALMSDAVRIATTLGHTRFHVIGHDWGGTIAWALAAHQPQRVRSLTTLAAPHPASLVMAARNLGQRARLAYFPVLQTRWLGESAFYLLRGLPMEAALVATGLPRELARRDIDHILKVGPSGPLNWYRAVRLPSDQRTGTVSVPTLYVWATRDPAFARLAAENTEAHVSGPYHFVELEGGTHWIPDLHWDDIEDLVIDHITAGD